MFSVQLISAVSNNGNVTNSNLTHNSSPMIKIQIVGAVSHALHGDARWNFVDLKSCLHL